MGAKGACMVQSQRDCHARLETSENPDFYPSAFRIEIPRENNASLQDVENIRAAGHGMINVLAGLAGMILCESISSDFIHSGCVTVSPARS